MKAENMWQDFKIDVHRCVLSYLTELLLFSKKEQPEISSFRYAKVERTHAKTLGAAPPAKGDFKMFGENVNACHTFQF